MILCCPDCLEPLSSGHGICECGRYYFHPWPGGGVLLVQGRTFVMFAEAAWHRVEQRQPARPGPLRSRCECCERCAVWIAS